VSEIGAANVSILRCGMNDEGNPVFFFTLEVDAETFAALEVVCDVGEDE
jgi:hypothetical protein